MPGTCAPGVCKAAAALVHPQQQRVRTLFLKASYVPYSAPARAASLSREPAAQPATLWALAYGSTQRPAHGCALRHSVDTGVVHAGGRPERGSASCAQLEMDLDERGDS